MALLLTLATGAWAQDPDPIDLTPSADSTVWTLITMPEYDVELEVTYYTDEEIYMEGVELTKVANGLWTLASTPAFDIELEIEYYTDEELYEEGVELTDNGDSTWTLSEMPAFDIELEIEYYKDPNLAWKIGTEDVPTEGVTAYTGFTFTAPTLVNEHNLAVSYKSTDIAVATINADGNVTIVALGTTTIKAIYPGDTTYQEDTASYQLTVLAPAVLTLAVNNSAMGAVSLVDTPDHVIPITTTAGTFKVIPGTEVTLNAEATAQHYVAGWKDENQNDLATATYSNYAVTTPSNMFPRTSALTFTVTSDTTAMAMFGINSSDITASVANTTDVRGTVKIDYTDVQGQSQSEGPTTASATVTAQGGSTSTLTAAPADGYHFVKWTNANGDSLSNLTTLSITSSVDTALVAVFDTNTYALTVVVANGQSNRGTVAGSNSAAKHFLEYQISATPETGYHFVQWNDGNTDNPRTVSLTQAMTFTASFDTNTYALNVLVADGQSNRGTVAGSNSAAKHFLEYQISATPETGYHFVQWNDGNTNNPRTVTLTQAMTFTASFAPDTFTVTYMNGTAQLKVEKVPYRESIPEYTPSKQGRTFDGWTPTLPELMPAENLTVYAQWTCDTLEDYDGNKYPSVQIGSKCWMAANLKTTHYADGRPVDNIYEYQSYAHPNVTENVSIYGRLYDWYATIDTATLTEAAHVQGICPDGWYLPTAEDVAVLSAIPATDLRTTTGWIAVNGNTNSTGFSAYPAGIFNSSLVRYEGMGTETSWWSTMDPDPSTAITPSVVITAKAFCTAYHCDIIFTKSYLPTDGLSVRCVLAEE